MSECAIAGILGAIAEGALRKPGIEFAGSRGTRDVQGRVATCVRHDSVHVLSAVQKDTNGPARPLHSELLTFRKINVDPWCCELKKGKKASSGALLPPAMRPGGHRYRPRGAAVEGGQIKRSPNLLDCYLVCWLTVVWHPLGIFADIRRSSSITRRLNRFEMPFCNRANRWVRDSMRGRSSTVCRVAAFLPDRT